MKPAAHALAIALGLNPQQIDSKRKRNERRQRRTLARLIGRSK